MIEGEKPQGNRLGWFLAGFAFIALALNVWADARAIDRLVSKTATLEASNTALEANVAALELRAELAEAKHDQAVAGTLLLAGRLANVVTSAIETVDTLQARVLELETAAKASSVALAEARRRSRADRATHPPASSNIRLQ